MSTTPDIMRDVIAPQSDSLEPEEFQSSIVRNMSAALLRRPSPPCLLRAPTGSGKTFMISRVLEQVCAERPTLWFWFVPFVNLVQQTEDALAANCPSLMPVMLSRGRNQDAAAGQVLLSTAQGVARAQWRKQGYSADADDDVRSLADTVARARAAGLGVGMVVDEAHIALDKQTEFGKFCQWLAPDYLVMATATPKDQRLTDFLAQAGYSGAESFTVSRDAVVDARLNKRYIEAVVYDTRESVKTIADLKATVLRQGWRRSQRIKRDLAKRGIPVVPLLLVQVANGPKTVEEVERDLLKHCGVPLAAIGKHSSDDPDPVLMAAIANDTSKEVLIFKQSAGTGFDAPRAFVLASTKSVNDPDFAMQFIGRVMRVTAGLRRAFAKPALIPAELDTAYVYLANAEAQGGFESAVLATSQVKNQLEGQTEKLVVRQTVSGAVVYSNRETGQPPLMYDMAMPTSPEIVPNQTAAPSPPIDGPQRSLFGLGEQVPDDIDAELDEVQQSASSKVAERALSVAPKNENELITAFSTRGMRVYRRKAGAKNLPHQLKREQRPEFQNMSAISLAAATRVEIPADLELNAVRAALGRLKERELHKELTTGRESEEEVRMLMDRRALAREAVRCLKDLPHVEDEDVRIMIDVLANRMLPAVSAQFDDADKDEQPDETSLNRFARDAAHWVVRKQADLLDELIQGEISAKSTLIDSGPLPDAMLFPNDIPLESSARNIYGVLPPSDDDLIKIPQVLMLDDRQCLKFQEWRFSDESEFRADVYDNNCKLNAQERSFAKALDRASFVAWWFRNPDRKRYAVRLVRGEHRQYFWPDFVVCIEHSPHSSPIPRLIETKENVKDAARKAKHVPAHYGRVLFLTKDEARFRIVEPDGTLGETIDLDDLTGMREWMRTNAPVM